jgi:hypothetical protein
LRYILNGILKVYSYIVEAVNEGLVKELGVVELV